MLFNTSEFIFIFLPFAVALHFMTARRGVTAAVIVTTMSSLVFYAYWNPPFVLLPMLSIGLNFSLARSIAKTSAPSAYRLMLVGVLLNLAVLGYFKYDDFVIAMFQARAPRPPSVPLALSFTTFVQIAFLVHVWRQRGAGAPVSFAFPHYAMFVAFFPHLIAGPIVRWSELGPQIDDKLRYRLDWSNIALGLTIFCLGLGKKVLIADRLAPHIVPVFDAAARGEPITAWAAWGAAFGYSAQLYFDFSGYCDMAVGLGLLFNLRLPINFAAPFRAASIIDLWRRWHITLSRFLRDFVYVPLGGSNCGPLRRSGNLIATMVLGGLWHGANWTFIAWGAFNGVLLVLNHAWRGWRGPHAPTRLGRFAGWCATFSAFAIGMAMFRSADVGAMHEMLLAMLGQADGPAPPDAIRVGADLYSIRHGYLSESFVHTWLGVNWSMVATLSTLGALAIALLVPDTMELVDYREGEPHSDWRRPAGPLGWRPSAAWLAFIGVVFAMAFTYFWEFNEFLYYQF